MEPTYGRSKAKILRQDSGGLVIHSFAHGSAIYELVMDAATFEAVIATAGADAAKVFALTALWAMRLSVTASGT
ncbi:hypothetical protein BQ8794_110280 [Mesorhizobium prunaredense]|uniref:Uncharacterized protein n=1 Tax=Mesorhizobium prunaredense TaxID=1631249 RepID=A0A1R3V404_9HYPH|nr:hypothetical protein [Mesorhizobium prunaredense]SIT53474.1 hypothetical protein BQ8794_110280 [Mesorhizobium prunaredense]